MSAHGPEHWARVERNARMLASVTDGADLDVCVWFARLHDTMRQNEFADPEHGPRAAAKAWGMFLNGELDGLSRDQVRLLCWTISRHDGGEVSANPTVGVCWDADRLELPRVGVEIDPELLSTEAGKDLARWRSEDS